MWRSIAHRGRVKVRPTAQRQHGIEPLRRERGTQLLEAAVGTFQQLGHVVHRGQIGFGRHALIRIAGQRAQVELGCQGDVGDGRADRQPPGTGSATYCSAVSLRQASRTVRFAQRSYANRATKSSCMVIFPELRLTLNVPTSRTGECCNRRRRFIQVAGTLFPVPAIDDQRRRFIQVVGILSPSVNQRNDPP